MTEKNKKCNRATNCDMCCNYVYNDEEDFYECQMALDEDETYRFLQGANESCPYFQLYDEYGIVRHQN